LKCYMVTNLNSLEFKMVLPRIPDNTWFSSMA
jgi:hypothetical protein